MAKKVKSEAEALGVFTHPSDADYDYLIAKAQEKKTKENKSK